MTEAATSIDGGDVRTSQKYCQPVPWQPWLAVKMCTYNTAADIVLSQPVTLFQPLPVIS